MIVNMIATLLASCSALSSSLIQDPLTALRRCGASPPSTPQQATEALAIVANAGVHPPEWLPVLTGKEWRPLFSANPDALKAAAADARNVPRPPGVADAKPGRMLKVDAMQSFTADGKVVNRIRLLRGFVSLSFCGDFDMQGRRMSIRFELLRVALIFGWIRFAVDIREGRGLRALLERWVRPRAAATTRRYKKRANVYAWCYADETLCVAAGSSGSVAVWEAVPPSESFRKPRAGAPPQMMGLKEWGR